MGKWNCYRQGCIFSWSHPVKLYPPLVRISHAYKWCATLCIQYTDSLNHIHRTHGKKSTVHSIRIFGIKRLYHIFIYIFFCWSIIQINRFLTDLRNHRVAANLRMLSKTVHFLRSSWDFKTSSVVLSVISANWEF